MSIGGNLWWQSATPAIIASAATSKAFSDAGAEGTEGFTKTTSRFPVVQSITPSTFSTAATSHLVSMPATVNAGDLLLCIFLLDGSGITTTPAGWTQVVYYNPIGGYSAGIYAKSAAGTEGGTTVDFVTSISTKAVAHVYRITAWSGDVTSVGIAQARGDFANNLQPDPPNLDPAGWAAEDTLWIIASLSSQGNVVLSVTSYPANYTNGVFTTSGTVGTADVQLATARRELNALAENPGAFTLNTAPTSEGSSAYTIAIRPILGIPKAFSDVGAEGAEAFSKVIAVNKGYSDIGPEGAQNYTLAKAKIFTDAGAAGTETYQLTKNKAYSDAGAEGSEVFSKTRFINPVYLKDRFEAVIIKILDS